VPLISFGHRPRTVAATDEGLLAIGLVEGSPPSRAGPSLVAGRYDLDTGWWTLLSPPPGPARFAATSVWSGDVWYVLGGTTAAGERLDGLAWSAADDDWTYLPPAPFSPATVHWDHDRLVVADRMGARVAVLDLRSATDETTLQLVPSDRMTPAAGVSSPDADPTIGLGRGTAL